VRTLIFIKQKVAALRDQILIKLIFCTAIIVNGRLETGFPKSSANRFIRATIRSPLFAALAKSPMKWAEFELDQCAHSLKSLSYYRKMASPNSGRLSWVKTSHVEKHFHVWE
jgi:hypothetical protein